MAFNGNLHEFGIVGLLQLPSTNRLTGRLAVTGKDAHAGFYYDQGKLIHAVCDGVRGNEVISEVIDWEEGRFEFDSGVNCETATVIGDLHHAIMKALKERDERRKQEEEAREEAERLKQMVDHAPSAAGAALPERASVTLPQSLLSPAPHADYACVINSSGALIAHTEAEPEYLGTIRSYLDSIRHLIRQFPDDDFGKVFFDHKVFSTGLSGDGKGNAVVIFAAPNTRLGVLSMELGKFVAGLEGFDYGD